MSTLKYALAGLLLLPLASFAHKPSDSYLSLDLTGAQPEGRWDIALRDLEYAIGVDADHDGAITWGELKARQDTISAYALARLKLSAGTEYCIATPAQQLVDNHSDGAYAVLRFALACPPNGANLSLNYGLFFELDPSHRGLLSIRYPDTVQTAVLSPQQPAIELTSLNRGRWRQLQDYWREGIWHIWIGFDHILFLVSLLLPVALRWDNGGWRAVDSLRDAFINAIGIVTAFTAAHSLTLSIAALGWVDLPSRWVEFAIAATVVLAALNNLYPVVRGRLWLPAFVLGLIHGFGFASVLTDLGLPAATLALALLGFNLGVESGQLVVVALLLPLVFGLRRSWLYRRVVLGLGSLAVAGIAVVWLLERSLALQLTL